MSADFILFFSWTFNPIGRCGRWCQSINLDEHWTVKYSL